VTTAALPTLFIASSTEGLGVAYDVQEALEFDCHSTVWPQGVFQPSRSILDDLTQALARHAFALFVFTPDDEVTMRGQTFRAVRDNVIFEMGMFAGALGVQRCVHLLPRGADNLHLPSDLIGLTALDYAVDRPDDNRLAALGPACNKMRRLLRAQARTSNAPKTQAFTRDAAFLQSQTATSVLSRYIAQWQSTPLSQDRAVLRAGIVLDSHDPEFPRAAMRRIFSFLESLSDAVLAGDVQEADARREFRSALLAFWPHACVLLAPPNLGAEAWDPLPSVARLHERWR
jgi:Predicted nucleotide-binding protein containing TIR-like domain